MRARLVAALLLAGTPAVFLGASEARNNFEFAAQQEYRLGREIGARVSSRVGEALESGWRDLELAAALPAVANVTRDCASTLQIVASTQQFLAVGRIDAEGALVCSSLPDARKINVAADDWWRNLQSGESRVASGLVVGPLTGKSVIVLATPVQRGGVVDGAVAGSMTRERIDTVIASEVDEDRGVYVFDRHRTLVAAVAGGLPQQPAYDAASAAAAGDPHPRLAGRLRVHAFRDPMSELIVATVSRPPARGAALAAAVTAAAPLLTILLGAVAMWLALEAWLLRHFRTLERRTAAFAAGRADRSGMEGAPIELAQLARSLDDAFDEALRRERELEHAAEDNFRLSRELHHRVKNNLQVLTSLANRQQKRASEPLVRAAIAEARARMLAVALVHRFIDPPEHLGLIDFDAYLVELARQLHAALSGDARGVRLEIQADSGEEAVDFASVVGLIVAETFVGGYRAAGGFSTAVASVIWRSNGERSLHVAVSQVLPADGIDVDMVRELARQAGAEVAFGDGAQVTLRWANARREAP